MSVISDDLFKAVFNPGVMKILPFFIQIHLKFLIFLMVAEYTISILAIFDPHTA
jgi:hypothetical protein